MLNPLDWIRNRSRAGRTASNLYGSIVTQARHPVFFSDYGVPDTAEGRYEVIVLHLSLALEGLRRAGEGAEALAQAVVEEFVRDLDGSMREMAVGDTSVPRKVKKAAGGLYDREALYRAAFAGNGDELAELVRELILPGGAAGKTNALVGYARAAHTEVCRPEAASMFGDGQFPSVDPRPFGDGARG